MTILALHDYTWQSLIEGDYILAVCGNKWLSLIVDKYILAVYH